MMRSYGGGMDWLGWFFGWPMMLAFWVIVVAAVIAVLRVGGGFPRTDHRTPEQFLDERLARGEIDVEDYSGRRDMLGAGRNRAQLDPTFPASAGDQRTPEVVLEDQRQRQPG